MAPALSSGAVALANLVESFPFDPSGDAGAISYNYTVQNPGSVLVVGIYSDGGGSSPTAILFGGQAADADQNGARHILSYYSNPAVGPLEITATITNPAVVDAGLFVMELTGVDLTAPVDSSNSTQITTTGNGAFIVASTGFNPFGGGYTITPAAGSVIDTPLVVDQDIDTPTGGRMGAGTATVGAAGTYDLGWLIEGGNFGDQTDLAYAFVPEPSVALLGGLGLLGLLRRRRA